MDELLEMLIKEAENSHLNEKAKLTADMSFLAESLKVMHDSFRSEGFSKEQAFDLTKIVLREGILGRTQNNNPSNPGYEEEPSADRNG